MRCERTSTKAPSHDIGRPPEVMHNSFPRTCRIYPSPLRPLELGLTAYSQLTPTKALYPIPVRQLLGLLSPSSPPRLTTAQLGSASSSANSVYAETFTRQELCRARHTIYIYILTQQFNCEATPLGHLSLGSCLTDLGSVTQASWGLRRNLTSAVKR